MENGITLGWNREGEDIEVPQCVKLKKETGVNQLRITSKLQKTYHVLNATAF
jgi:hypothetical protein